MRARRLVHTVRLLEGFCPHDEREAACRERILAFLREPGDAFDRQRHLPGHLTASAVVLSPERDAVLLILHGKLGLWLQPGGHIEPTDADVCQAARREVLEEAGIEELLLLAAPLDLDIHAIPAYGSMPAHEHFDVRLLFQAPTRAVRAGSDALGARWIPFDRFTSDCDTGRSGLRTDASVRRAVAAVRRRRW